jgi:hypothetical protein
LKGDTVQRKNKKDKTLSNFVASGESCNKPELTTDNLYYDATNGYIAMDMALVALCRLAMNFCQTVVI